MYIPITVIVGILAFLAGAGAMFGVGLWANHREKARVARLLRETLPDGED